MLRDVLVITVSLAIPVVLLAAWLRSEFRSRPPMRIALGLACMFYLCVQIGIGIQASAKLEAMHAASLRRMRHSLEKGNPAKVLRAIRSYHQWVDQTSDHTLAVGRMMITLDEQESP